MLLQGVTPSEGIEFLRQCRWEKFYPELTAIPSGKRKNMLALLDRCASLRTGERQKDLVLMGTALVLFMDKREDFLRRLWNRHDMIEKIILHAEALADFVEAEKNTFSPVQIRHLALKLKGVELFCLLLQGTGLEKSSDTVRRLAQTLGVFQKAPEPLLTGKHGIEAGICPGPELGQIMKECFDAQLAGAFCDLEGGKSFLKHLLEKRK
jgi:tRNA nucleotidyltransferase (CCA-adding enzyme)